MKNEERTLKEQVTIDESNDKVRLDKALFSLLEGVSRSKLQDYIKDGYILVNEKEEKPSYVLRLGDTISIYEFPKEETNFKATKMDLDIVYEDDYLMVINKPKGLVTHPGAGNYDNTLANGVAGYSDSLSDINGDFRPGIVHRLDKDTAGLLVIAKDNETHLFLQEQLKDHTLGRTYTALILGHLPSKEAKIIAPIGRDKNNRLKMAVDIRNGKDAVTNVTVLEVFKDYTLVECRLETGRTHQIRVHLDYIGHPVVGDPLYGKGNRLIYKDGQLLVATKISFIHPKDKKRMEFSIPLPSYFVDVLNSLH